MIWRLDNGARTYLPRMAGALTAITAVPSDPACYVLTQADNTIRMVRTACHSEPLSAGSHHSSAFYLLFAVRNYDTKSGKTMMQEGWKQLAESWQVLVFSEWMTW